MTEWLTCSNVSTVFNHNIFKKDLTSDNQFIIFVSGLIVYLKVSTVV